MIEKTQLVDQLRRWMDVFSIQSMHAWTRYVRACGLSMPQFGILMNLTHKNTCGVSDISERMQISPAAASQLVDKLVQGELLERTEDPADRRVRKLVLSEKGRALINEGNAARFEWVEELIEYISPEDYEKVADGLDALIRAAKRQEAIRIQKNH